MPRLRASAARAANSITRRFITGRAPGSPKHTEQVFEFGSSPKRVEQPQNSFDSVLSWACISRPITASYLSLIDVSIGGLSESIASSYKQSPSTMKMDRVCPSSVIHGNIQE